MMQLRLSADRGRGEHGWLDSRHTFSFADYSDPRYNGFGALRVINEDRVQAGKGFGKHSHRDMEIISYVLEGALAHEDDLGNGSVIRPGDVQRMTAGTGVEHSEFNHSKTEPVHFLQIWIIPERRNIAPGYEERNFSADSKRNVLKLVASRGGRDGSLTVHRDVDLYSSLLGAGHEVVLQPAERLRKQWLQVARGQVSVDDKTLQAGDGGAFAYEERIAIRAVTDSEILLFDMG